MGIEASADIPINVIKRERASYPDAADGERTWGEEQYEERGATLMRA
jgi:hypothetical protein